jgi:cyclopropane fatty-acyl-phospholipid synthase-like methyltransferase
MPLNADEPTGVRYNAEVFDVRSIDEAKRIILTDEDGETEERWQRETPYLVDRIVDFLTPGDGSLLLDYGCGIGRISKELIARSGCRMIGVDISMSMCQLAPGYVGDKRFAACGWPVLEAMQARGMRVNGAVAIWSLQHSPRVEDDIKRIHDVLEPGGGLFVCTLYRAAVPTNVGWVDTGFDIQALLADSFDRQSVEAVSADHTTAEIAEAAFIGRYRKAAG